MNKSFFSYILLFVILVLVQALLMNHIVLFSSAVCFIFIYFLIKLPISLSANLGLTLGFLLGLSVDMLSDTPGLNALCCTVLASLRRPVFFAYEQHDDKNRDVIPSIGTMGFFNFSKYVFSMSAIYCLLAFFVEFIQFTDITDILIKAGSSTLFTFLVLLAIDSLVYKN
ncbi:MAG: rod shape-determining protein MreD [Muribaculaceae bacterium]|nr:rod shape-determining protein MreD [Muribaculaceae bacterium]